jgi:hypothetical protein
MPKLNQLSFVKKERGLAQDLFRKYHKEISKFGPLSRKKVRFERGLWCSKTVQILRFSAKNDKNLCNK